ncbi:MAG: regulatory protein RecX [Ignavibacteriae bacterium]|nr:regulatory protein RecX [Ignavibacteriota bacterium]
MFDQLIITRILKRRRRPLCIVFAGDDIALECAMDLVLEFKLGKGVILTEQLKNTVLARQRIIDAKQRAVAFATYKPRTEAQVRLKLQGVGFSVQEQNLAIQYLKEFDYLNDAEYTRMFVKDFLLRKPSSASRVKMELRKRGIAELQAQDAIDQFFPKDDTSVLALKAAQKKLRSVTHKPIDKQKTALIGYLQRQGFSWDIIKDILSRTLGNTVSSDEKM